MAADENLERDKAELRKAAQNAEQVADEAKDVAEDAADLAAKLKKDSGLE